MSQFVSGMKVMWVADPEGNIIELNQGYVDEDNPRRSCEGQNHESRTLGVSKPPGFPAGRSKIRSHRGGQSEPDRHERRRLLNRDSPYGPLD